MDSRIRAEVSIEKIISELSQTRITSLNVLLHDESLQDFMEEQFGVVAISKVKTEFIKRSLKELRDSPIDLVHYAALIKECQVAGIPESLAGNKYYLVEVKQIFERYGFK